LFKEKTNGAENVTDKSGKVADKVVDEVVDEVVDKLTDNQKNIIALIKRNPYISAREIAPQVGISHRKIQENIAKLKEYGILERIGPAKGGHWKIIKNNKL
jgi:ATP-dependent DNA helicase RecG